MLTEEVGQVYQAMAPLPLWFRYLVTYQEVDGTTGLTLGVLLALLYFILKVRKQSVYAATGQYEPVLKFWTNLL